MSQPVVRGVSHGASLRCGVLGCDHGTPSLGLFKTGAPLPPPLRNPEVGGTTWYHGTDFDPNEEDENNDEDGEGGKVRAPDRDHGYEVGENIGHHWNTDLGAHFTSLKHVARTFAGDSRDSRILHAGLHMANPKNYDNEWSMGKDAIEHAHSKGLHFLPHEGRIHDAFIDGEAEDGDEDTHEHVDRLGHIIDETGPRQRKTLSDISRGGPQEHHSTKDFDDYLRYHPDREEVTSGFRDHLKSQGHDGITYGNEYEGPRGHRCAIAFPDTPIHHRKWEWLHPNMQPHNEPGEAQPREQVNGQKPLFYAALTPEDAALFAEARALLAAAGRSEDIDALGRSEHPNVTPYISGGIGHREGDESRSVVGFLPTRLVKRYREHAGDWNGEHSKRKVAEIRADIESGEGIHEPLVMEYDHKMKWGYLGEGNHRLRAAEEAGAKTVPVRIYGRGRCDSAKEHYIGNPMEPNVVFGDDPGYSPPLAHPHNYTYGTVDSEHTAARDASGLPEGYTMHVEEDPKTERWGLPALHVKIRHGGRPMPVAGLSVHQRLLPGESSVVGHPNVSVDEQHQHKGLATAMYAEVHKRWPGVPIVHSEYASDDARGLNQTLKEEFGPDLHRTSVRLTGPASGQQYSPHEWSHPHDWLPSVKMFAPGKHVLDPRLFLGDAIKASVRTWVVDRISAIWTPEYHGWKHWARIYLAGSEATYWWGDGQGEDFLNNDLDILVGVQHDQFRQTNPEHKGLSDVAIDEMLTQQFREHFNDEGADVPWEPYGNPWHVTAFVNPHSWDIRDIKPYGAYEILSRTWYVRPPDVPEDWGPKYWDESTWSYCEATLALVNTVRAMPEPTRTRRGAMLYDAIHTDRSTAFSEHGEGWLDPANVVLKFLDQEPSHPFAFLVECKRRMKGGLDVEAAVDHEPEWVAGGDFDEQRQALHGWRKAIRHGLSMGHVSPQEAQEAGYHGSGHERDYSGRLGWEPLPHTLFHVTTDADSVRQHGLKSRDELAQASGKGLGGGESDTVSFTQDPKVAEDIHHALHEFHHVVTGRKTIQSMYDDAKAGTGADEPYHHIIHAVNYGQNDSSDESVPSGLKSHLKGYQRHNGMMFGTREDIEAKHPGEGWEPHPDGTSWIGGQGKAVYGSWHRPQTEDEKRETAASFYKVYAAGRENAGGRMNPTFFSSDTKGFAAMDPKGFKVMKFHPKSGARGYQVSGLGEWRTATGQNVDLDEPEGKTAAKEAALSLQDYISVAEHSMEESGHTGHQWHLPSPRDFPEKSQDPGYLKAMQPVHDYVHHVLTSHGWPDGGQRITVHPKAWDLREPGSGQASTDGMNSIGLKGTSTHDLTLLHECAHVLDHSREGEGHTRSFADIAHGLYRDHLGPKAADHFHGIVSLHPSYDEPESKTGARLYHGTRADLSEGDVLRPSMLPSVHVWMTTDLAEARDYASRALGKGEPKVYEVHAPDASPRPVSGRYTAPLATVVRQVVDEPEGKEALLLTAARADDLYGSNDIEKMFPGEGPITTPPWPMAYRTKKAPLYSKQSIGEALRSPEQHMDEVDPRGLHSSQSGVTRAGVQYYLGDQYRKTGATYADPHHAGNQVPVVYSKADGRHVLLSGHHRAAAALLKGEPLRALHIHEEGQETHDSDRAAQSVRQPLALSRRAPEALVWDDRGDDRRGGAAGDRAGRDRRAALGVRGGGGSGADRVGSDSRAGVDPAADGERRVSVAKAEPCECCGATGEHSTGHECYTCDASGSTSQQEICDGHPAVHAFGCENCDGGRTAAKAKEVEVAGILIKAQDTGRILLLQRSYDDKDDPARGQWEAPGGHLEEGESPLEGGQREWLEETGCRWPTNARMGGDWLSGSIYQGYVVLIPKESALDINLDSEDRDTENPDDPGGDAIETLAWWDVDHIARNVSIRKEFRTGTDWALVKRARYRDGAAKVPLQATARRTAAEDYWGNHRPGDDGSPLHDLLAADSFPPNVYDELHHYIHGSGGTEQYDRDSIRAVRSARGKPEKPVTIYRAAPHGTTHIHPGDWVALSRAYAEHHAMQDDDPSHDWPVYSATVPAKHILNGGNDIIEWGYHGPASIPVGEGTTKKSRLTEYPDPEENGFYAAHEGRQAGPAVGLPRGGRRGAPARSGRLDAPPLGGRQGGTGGDGAPREVTFHPGATKDLKHLDAPVRRQVQQAIDGLANDDPTVLAQTHRLTLALKGWSATKVSRGHRVVHRSTEDGGIHVGYVGLHEYDKAIQRLTARDLSEHVSKGPIMAFHVSHARNREAILKDGVQPGWKGEVHVMTDVDQARDYAADYGEHGGEGDVFHVVIPGGTPYHIGVYGEHHLVVKQPLAPARLVPDWMKGPPRRTSAVS